MGPQTRAGSRWAGRAIVGLALLALVVPILALVKGGWTLTAGQWVFYGAIPALVGVSLLGFSFLWPHLRLNLVIALAATALSLVMAEIAISFAPLARSGVVFRPSEPDASWDGRSPREIVLDLRAQGLQAYPRISAPLAQVIRIGTGTGDSIQPLSPSPSEVRVVFCNEAGHPVMYDSDEYGFNNPRGLWSHATVEAVLIGDSFTHGACVPLQDHFSQRLRKVIPDLLNLGVAGAGPLTELAILREYAAAKTPRKVFWVFYEGNDRYDVRVENANKVLSRYRDDPTFRQNLRAHQDAINMGMSRWADSALAVPEGDWAITFGDRVRGAITLSGLRRLAGIGVPVPTREPPALNIPDILATAVAEVRSWGGTFYLVYLPEYARYSSWLGSGTRGRSAILATADSLGVQVIDLVPVFDSLPSPTSMWSYAGGHLTAEGYGHVAAALFKALATDGLTSLNPR